MTTIALLFALAMVLSVVEASIMPIFALPPGVKLGLSNIVVMYCMVYMGYACAAELTILKGLFAFFTRGATAGFLAAMGGFFSITIMFILSKIFKDKINYYTLSIFGALFHNIGQLSMAAWITGTAGVFSYLPVLLVAGVITGGVIGLLGGLVTDRIAPAVRGMRR